MPGIYRNFFSLPEEANELRWENTSYEYARRNLENLSRTRWDWIDTTRIEDTEYSTGLLRVVRQSMPDTISNRLFTEIPMEAPRDINLNWTISFNVPKKIKQMEIE